MSMIKEDRKRPKGSGLLPNLDELPARVDRETAAALLSKYYFKISPRSLERWALAWRILNGRAHCETVDLFAVAEAILAEAPAVMGGRSRPSEQRAV
jgi:hypothetical protein